MVPSHTRVLVDDAGNPTSADSKQRATCRGSATLIGAVNVATSLVSNIGWANPNDMQRSLNNHQLDRGEDRYLLVVLSVHELQGH